MRNKLLKVDKKNKEIMHFRLHLSLLLFSLIAFDNSYLWLLIIRPIWGYICNYIEGFSYELHEKFSNILKKELGGYYLQCYKASKSLAILHSE